MSNAKKYDRAIVWFRRDLRVADNLALAYAAQNAHSVIPLFVLDSTILSRPDTGKARVVFLLDALTVLDRNLNKIGGRLIVLNGKTPDTLLDAVREYQADLVVFHREYEPFGQARDAQITRELASAGIACEIVNNLVVSEPGKIVSKAGTPYTVFTPFKRVWFEHIGQAPEPSPEQISVPDEIAGLSLPICDDVLKIETSQTFECGGEDAAQLLLDQFIQTGLSDYEVERDILGHDGTSRLSRHLHFGTISPREIVLKVQNALRGADFKTLESGKTFLSELAWRDFYFQILSHFPYVAEGAFRKQYDAIKWENDETLFAAWKSGQTGYPIVDAAMRQLNAEAWMHNRGRMIVASFLTKDLLIDWRWGERYFMQMLVDGDLAANNGGWQWAAGTGTDAQPYFRIFNPTSQGEKFDPTGSYVRRWVPELAQVPDRMIHTPWKLSASERDYLGCAAYPSPVVDHGTQRLKALSLYKAVS